MTPIPVVCDDCGQLWVTDHLFGFEGSGAVRVEFENIGVAPCPYCGGTGHVPGGMYELRENMSRYLGALKPADMQALLALATEAKDRNLSAEQVAERIATDVPAASGLGALLKDGGTSVAAWLAVLIALLTWLHPLAEKQKAAPTSQQMERAFEQALERVVEQQDSEPPGGVVLPRRAPAPARKSRKQKVETRVRLAAGDPCWCGPGSKFKHCHGR